MESYVNDFSKIGQLQEEEKISYGLIESSENQHTLYGITVTSQKCGKNYTFSHSKLSDSKHLVENLAKYLYENSVKAEHSKEIIEDILGQSSNLIAD
jgi:hypothetical protein